MPIILTITNEIINMESKGLNYLYDYSQYDRILKNIHKDEYEVFYSGQNRGRIDYQLIEAIENKEPFKIYYRKKKSVPYKYLGETNNVNIIQYRKVPVNRDSESDERLQIHLIITNISNINVGQNNFNGSGKYKKDILVHAGLRDTNNNKLKSHDGNTNIGFYYYNET